MKQRDHDPKRTPPHLRGEQPSTYFVQDRSNKEEQARLRLQDKMITENMGGVLPEQADPASFQHVLDVGCGTGGWLIELAKTYPSIVELVGVDISQKMVEYAQAQAQAQQVSEQVTFRVMDALQTLAFPADSFDLVNLRFATSFMRTWDWRKLLGEFQRVSKPSGVVRITEAELAIQSDSEALTRLCTYSFEALHRAGYLFRPSGDGLTSELEHQLHQLGLQDVQTRSYPLEYRAGTERGQGFYEDMKRLFRNGLPFWRKWMRVPQDYEELYQQAMHDMRQPDFVAIWPLLTAWGTGWRTRKQPSLMQSPLA